MCYVIYPSYQKKSGVSGSTIKFLCFLPNFYYSQMKTDIVPLNYTFLLRQSKILQSSQYTKTGYHTFQASIFLNLLLNWFILYLFECFQVQARYSQGMWWGKLVSDYINFPSLPNVPEVRTDVALITRSQNFFMNGSGWQVNNQSLTYLCVTLLFCLSQKNVGKLKNYNEIWKCFKLEYSLHLQNSDRNAVILCNKHP